MKQTLALSLLLLLTAAPSGAAFSTRHNPKSSLPSSTLLFASSPSTTDLEDVISRLTKEAQEVGECAQILGDAIFKADAEVKAEDIVQICDTLDALKDDVEAGKGAQKLFPRLNAKIPQTLSTCVRSRTFHDKNGSMLQLGVFVCSSEVVIVR